MHEVKLVVNFVYILLGMAMVAMCYYLLKDLVRVKLNQLNRKINDKLDVIKHKMRLANSTTTATTS